MTGKCSVVHPAIRGFGFALILCLSTGVLAGCGSGHPIHPLDHSGTGENAASQAVNVTNAVSDNLTVSVLGNAASSNPSPPSPATKRTNRTGNEGNQSSASASSKTAHVPSKSSTSSQESKASKPTTAKSKRSGNAASGHNSTTLGTNRATSSGTSRTTSGNTANNTSGSRSPLKPSGIDVTWTNRLNNPYVARNYTGPNSSLFAGLVQQMAEGKTSVTTAKATISALQPWNAVWTSANNGDGKTYTYHVNDVGDFVFQIKQLTDDVIAKEWQTHSQAVLDDGFYGKWAVYWNATRQEYTVAFLDVGFYLASSAPSQNTTN